MKSWIPLLAIALLTTTGLVEAADVVVELPSGVQIPDAARAGPGFDVDKATAAYLALLTPEQRARSDAYFEGGYWITLWQALYTIGTCVLIVSAGWARRTREWARARTSRGLLESALTIMTLVGLVAVLGAPFDWYTGFLREHQYGMSNQTFRAWLRDWAVGAAVTVVLLTVGLTVIYAFIRRSQDRWVLRATAFLFVFMILLFMIMPVFVAPLFNDYKPLPAGETRDAILSLARANQIPTTNVMWFDASRQTKRISANVSGMFGTTRVSLNDNLLDRTSLPEIKAVMGHEMGHYVLNHPMKDAVYFTMLFGIAFLLLDWIYRRPLLAYRRRNGIGDRGDAAGVPLAWAVLTALLLVASPVFNRISYSAEAEADMFGLDAAREPYGFATSAMRIGAYRKLEPGPVEEFLFYDHPSGYNRVHRAMIWLKENQGLVTGPPHQPMP